MEEEVEHVLKDAPLVVGARSMESSGVKVKCPGSLCGSLRTGESSWTSRIGVV